MNPHELIFSDTRPHRVTRHIIFWLCWILFASAVQLTGPDLTNLHWNEVILYQLIRTINRLLPQMLFCYATVYFLVPRFIPKKKYLQFFLSLSLLCSILVVVTFFIFYKHGGFINISQVFNLPSIFNQFTSTFYSFYSNINFTGAIPACCLMLTIKYYKDWYKKQRESEMLTHENKLAELQLLRAQIHPHFLFNTLNNIYSFTLTGSSQAAGLVDKLSGMIDYMISEGEKSVVTLEKEIQLINDYIGLEKVRYGDRLDMVMKITGNYKDKMIAPLLMIPFVENCFKHGTSKVLRDPWIKLFIQADEHVLHFNLTNSKPAEEIINGKKGIGLTNIKKRLELMYPANHLLKIESTMNTFTINMQIPLQQINRLSQPVTKHTRIN